jgi:hypothetical protein
MLQANNPMFYSPLSNDEAKKLLYLEKIQNNDESYLYPNEVKGGKLQIPLISIDKTETFIFNLNKKRLNFGLTYQTRARGTIILARLDLGGFHTNPDRQRIGSPHLHIYTERFGDGYAIIPEWIKEGMSEPEILNGFMKFCHIREDIKIKFQFQPDLFS